MWRPANKEWERTRNKYFEPNQPKAPYYKTRQLDYEAGADAMLEGLAKEIEEIYYLVYPEDPEEK